jgi:hypothetical protein
VARTFRDSLPRFADGRLFGIVVRDPSTRSDKPHSLVSGAVDVGPLVDPAEAAPSGSRKPTWVAHKAIFGSDTAELRGRVSTWIFARILLFLLLSSLPLLAIAAHELGLVSLRTSALLLILPVVATLAVVTTVAPHPIDGIVGRGLIAGMVACLAYDAFRLTAVYALGWMGDFIPMMGTGITSDPDVESGAAVGYIWRYIGDGGGLGVAFYLIAFAVGLDRWSRWPAKVVLAAAAFGVFVWTGLVALVALTPRGGELFHLRPDTLTITLIGHVIFGVFVGLAFLRVLGRGVQWPWPSLLSQLEHRRLHKR